MLLESQILKVRILSLFLNWYLLFVPFFGLAAPPVRSAGRGRAQQRRGAHSTCKLILEMCARFLILNLLKILTCFVYIHICMIIIIIIDLLRFDMHA